MKSIAVMHNRLKASHTRNLLAHLEAIETKEVTIGTVCSGTDMPTYVMSKLCKHWEQTFGIQFQWSHVFSCERAAVAQDWILRHHKPRFLFESIGDLWKEMCYDLKSRANQPAYQVDLVLGGTECDNYSQLNFGTRAGAEGVASSGIGKSGSTLDGFWKYIHHHRPRAVVWENSDRTKAADLAHLSSLLWKAGYMVLYQKVDARDFSPQSRPRIYLIAAFSQEVLDAASQEARSDEWKELRI